MNRVQHDDIWNSEFTNISIKKFVALDPTTQNTNRFLSRMITFLAILSTLRDRKEEKKSFAPWHAYHWIIEPHYIHALQGHSGCWAGAAAVHTHTRSYNKTATDFSYIYLSLAHSFSSANARDDAPWRRPRGTKPRSWSNTTENGHDSNDVCQGQADEATTVKCRLGRTAELHYVKLLPPLSFACCAATAVPLPPPPLPLHNGADSIWYRNYPFFLGSLLLLKLKLQVDLNG